MAIYAPLALCATYGLAYFTSGARQVDTSRSDLAHILTVPFLRENYRVLVLRNLSPSNLIGVVTVSFSLSLAKKPASQSLLIGFRNRKRSQ